MTYTMPFFSIARLVLHSFSPSSPGLCWSHEFSTQQTRKPSMWQSTLLEHFTAEETTLLLPRLGRRWVVDDGVDPL